MFAFKAMRVLMPGVFSTVGVLFIMDFVCANIVAFPIYFLNNFRNRRLPIKRPPIVFAKPQIKHLIREWLKLESRMFHILIHSLITQVSSSAFF